MNRQRYLKNVVTLELDAGKCTGCGMCEIVCPHAVFELDEGGATIRDRDACMECGAAPYVRIEILCKDELVERIVAVIQQYAHEGLKGDGKIVVSSIETAIRISTGETGDDAL